MDLLGAMMLIGGVGGAIKTNSDNSISDACSDFSKSNNELRKQINEWKGLINHGLMDDIALKNLGQTLTLNLDFYKEKKKQIKQVFEQREFVTIVSLSIFIFSIIFTLLMRYFNVYTNIWNFIVGNK